ncbi:phosphoglycolate phosphatase [Thioclava sp. BHET1]|nr:phosphoglycolate phosphatase [Thioclava sp. BHET1]
MSAPCVIFDLDGTLIDSVPAIHAISNTALREMGLAELSEPKVRSFVGKGVPNLVRQLLIASGKDPDGPLFAQAEAALLAHYETDLEGNTPYPFVIEALDQLSEMGCALAICTNKPLKPAEAVLDYLGLRERFALVLGGDSLPSRKPDPEMLRACHVRLGGGPMVYVGDSEVDAQTAENANAPFVLYTEGYRHTPVQDLPHQVAFADYRMLPGIIGRFQKDTA